MSKNKKNQYDQRLLAFTIVGTPEYIAPEVYFNYTNFNKYVKICLMIKVIKNKLKTNL